MKYLINKNGVYLYFPKFKALLEIQCLTTSFYHFLYVVDAIQQFQQKRRPMKRLEKLQHIAGQWEKRVNADICHHI